MIINIFSYIFLIENDPYADPKIQYLYFLTNFIWNLDPDYLGLSWSNINCKLL